MIGRADIDSKYQIIASTFPLRLSDQQNIPPTRGHKMFIFYHTYTCNQLNRNGTSLKQTISLEIRLANTLPRSTVVSYDYS